MVDYKIMQIQFAQAKQPKFSERKGSGMVLFGDDNTYPSFLNELYLESPKHGAIIKSKSTYIFGNGFSGDLPPANGGETWNDVLRNCVLDYEKFGGYYLQVVWSKAGTLAAVYYLKFHKVRTNADNSMFWVKDEWDALKQITAKDRIKERPYTAFDVNDRKGTQILFVKAVGDQNDVYPLPSYIQALNYIDADRIMSRHILGMAKDGFVASKLINFNEGEPSNEQKQAIEKGLKKKFTGSEGDKFIVAFNKNPANAVTVTDLGTSQLTKEDFTNINLLIQQEIFASHQVTSPMLFGIKTEGQLGGRSELRDAYEIFKNTYVNDRQKIHEEIFSGLFMLAGINVPAKIVPTEPLGIEFSEATISQTMTKEEIRDKLGLPELKTTETSATDVINAINSLSPLVANKVLESMDANEIRSLVGLVPKAGGSALPAQTDANGNEVISDGMVNDNLKNLTGRQMQNILRVVRQYSQGKLTRPQAVTMLSSGYGLSEADILNFLGEDVQQFSGVDPIQIFESFGESRKDFVLLNQYDFKKDSDYIQESFAEIAKLDKLSSDILAIIAKDKKITPEGIAEATGKDLKVVKSVLDELVSNDYIKEKDGIRTLTKPLSEVEEIKPSSTKILVRYSYEWKSEVPVSERNTAAHPSRDFCKRLMSLDKFYTRGDIETISQRVGYSVFDRAGGWWTMPDGDHSPSCRHRWVANVLIKK